MDIFFAPMEGVTGPQFRRAHHDHFSGVDKYYLPFISPTQDHVFTAREIRNVGLEANQGIEVVPQLLTKNARDFLWCARGLGELGHREVNLNLGCPSATVVTKGKGAGMLRDPDALERFLDEIFSAELGDLKISIKTRLGLESPEEFPRLAEIFHRFPIALLIVHPRVRTDFYKVPVRGEEFVRALPGLRCPVCYNGGIVTAAGYARAAVELPQVGSVMIGQGLAANPALARQAKGGPPLDREELRAFHDQLYHTYLRDFSGERSAVFHMKELWGYFSRMFDGGGKLFKEIKKAQNARSYESAAARIFDTLPIRREADWENPSKI